MAEDEKKALEPEDEKKVTELADEDLEEVAGGFIYIPSMIANNHEALEKWIRDSH